MPWSGSGGSLRTAIVVLLTGLIACLPMGARAVGDRSGFGGARVGTVETLAGPGFCVGEGDRDDTSETVRALAVDSQGRTFVDTGPLTAGIVEKVDRDGELSRMGTGIPAPPDDGDPLAQDRRHEPSASRLAPDGQGGLYVATGATIAHVEPNTGLATIAGDPASRPGSDGSGSSGDGGPASEARFASARSVATDDAGNLYVSDQLDRQTNTVRIRIINRGGQPVIVYPGTPQQLSVLPGHIDTIVGRGGSRNSGDGGPARQATVQGVPPSLAVVGRKLYIGVFSAGSDSREPVARVRLVNLGGTAVSGQGTVVAPGNIETVAGGGPRGDPRDGARRTAFSYLPGLAAGLDGSLYLADEQHHRILKVDPAGSISTFAGGGSSSGGAFDGNERPARAATLNRPYDVKVGPDGRVYISDRLNGQVRVVDSNGVIHATRGANAGLTWTCRAAESSPHDHPMPPLLPLQGGPSSVAADAAGNVFFATAAGDQIKRLDASNRVTTVVGGKHDPSCFYADGCGGFSGDGGAAAAAQIRGPSGIALGPSGGLYVMDRGNARIRVVNLGSAAITVHGVTIAPGDISTVAGNGKPGIGGDGGTAVNAQLTSGAPRSYPGFMLPFQAIPPGELALASLAVDAADNLFIADGENHRVRKVDPSGIITTFAGEGSQGPLRECCQSPFGLVLDAAGNVYVSDRLAQPVANFETQAHPRVWVINRTGHRITVLGQAVAPARAAVVAGNGKFGLAHEGSRAAEGPLLSPTGLVVDRRGNLYIAEVGSIARTRPVSDLLRVDNAGVITTVAGGTENAFNGDGLRAKLTALNYPGGLAFDQCGNLLIADLGNDRVRRLNLGPPCQSGAAVGGSLSEASGSGRGITLVIVGLVVVASGALVYRRLRRMAR